MSWSAGMSAGVLVSVDAVAAATAAAASTFWALALRLAAATVLLVVSRDVGRWIELENSVAAGCGYFSAQR